MCIRVCFGGVGGGDVGQENVVFIPVTFWLSEGNHVVEDVRLPGWVWAFRGAFFKTHCLLAASKQRPE